MIKIILRKNLISLGIHICISLIVCLFFGIIFNLIPILVGYSLVYDVFIFFLVTFLYLYSGYRFQPNEKVFWDFSYFILISIVGILLWIYAVNETHNISLTYDPNNAFPWWAYSLYYSGINIFQDLFDKLFHLDYSPIQAYVIFIWNIIPSSLMFIGMEARRLSGMKKAKV